MSDRLPGAPLRPGTATQARRWQGERVGVPLPPHWSRFLPVRGRKLCLEGAEGVCISCLTSIPWDALRQFLNNAIILPFLYFQHKVSESLLCVKLKILSNWGHTKYTCVYRFRVHGAPAAAQGRESTEAPPPRHSRARTP